MDGKEIKETNVWVLYDKLVMFARKHGMYEEVDRNNNFYNGNQWDGLIVEGIEPVQFNYIKPIVNYKTSKLTKNNRAINYNANNVENSEFRAVSKKVCDLLTQRAARVWENNQMDNKIRKMVKQAAINGESIIYVSYNENEGNPENEVLNKVDVYYGNENDSDIQNQPYILVKQRMSVLQAREVAEYYGVKKKELDYIIGDNDNIEEAGQDAKDEVDNMVTVVTKFYKSKGLVKFSKSTKFVDIVEDADMGTTLYPIAHMIWEDKEGSARGEGEVRQLIPNQIETNKTAMRRLLTAKNTAYPQKIYNRDKIDNPEAIDIVGGVIEAKGMDVDDVNKVFAVTKPAQMSPDVEKLQNELISITRELANASETATGQVNPEDASGRAILAVQQASEQPLSDQNTSINVLLEDLARIWLDMWKTYNDGGMQLEDIQINPLTGEEELSVVPVEASVLEELKTTVNIDVTPKGAYDKYAQEISLENLAKTEQFMNTAWLEDYVSLLDNDAVMPKLKLEELIKRRKKAQERIREVQQQANMMQMQVDNLINSGEILPKEMEQYMGANEQPVAEEPMVSDAY
jgi:hypothetical protein